MRLFKVLRQSEFSWAPLYRGLHRPWPTPGLGVCRAGRARNACITYLDHMSDGALLSEELARALLMENDPSRVEFDLIGYELPGRVSDAHVIGYDVVICEDRSVITDCILFEAVHPSRQHPQASWRARPNEHQLFGDVDAARSLLRTIQDGTHVASDWAGDAEAYAILGCDLVK